MEENGCAKGKQKIRPQLIASIIINISVLSCGACYAYSMSNSTKVPKQEKWISLGVPLGALIGPIASALLIDRISRKWFLYLTSIPFIACWVLAFVVKTWTLLLVGRLLAGVSVGAIFSVVPLYLGEIVETKIRGVVGTMIPVFFNIGFLLVQGVHAMKIDPKILSIVCLAPTVVFMLTAIWLPESPYYYLKKKKEKHANLSLIWLRNTTDNKRELEEISEFVKTEEKEGLKELFTDCANRRALLLVLLLLAAQQLSGFLTIQSRLDHLLKEIPFKIRNAHVLLILTAVAIAIGILSSFVVDRIGRKPLFLVSGYVTGLCLCLLATYFLLSKKMNLSSFGWAPLAIILVYYIFLSIGLAPIPAIVSSEIFSMKVRHWATMVTGICGAFLYIIVAQCYPLIIDAGGYPVILYVFGVIELVIATAAAVVMPETSRKSFKEIQDILKKRSCKPKEKITEEHTKPEMITEEN
ncbi:facilitated trehalose transporter Tret1-like [Colletes gigas]|uniref:facilitated trehalose transporter Tret1-like n=1 Tax=Colletes gigas TaxID=935657 RepID=UPI001C9A7B68|nr:facilitated trehalose transporter Tret1-like [Colletes gigas]